MKFSSFFSLAFVSIAAASPVANQVEKRLDLTPVTDLVSSEVSSTVSGVAEVANSTSGTVDTIVADVESLLSTLISDVEGVASAAGIDVSDLLKTAGIVSKRDNVRADLERRDVNAVISAVTKLITDLLGSIVTLAGDAGISLVGTLLSMLNI